MPPSFLFVSQVTVVNDFDDLNFIINWLENDSNTKEEHVSFNYTEILPHKGRKKMLWPIC